MASQDNEKAMDGLLRRSLARDGEASSSAKGECPDPELLAAYYDKSLGATEVAELDLHFSDCARCREQLAALVRTDAEVDVDADVLPELVPLSAAAPAKGSEIHAAALKRVNVAPLQLPKSAKSQAPRPRPLLDLRWLAPLAAAIILAVFIYLRIPPHRAGVASNNEIAMNTQPSAQEAQPAGASAPIASDAAAPRPEPSRASRSSASASRSDATSRASSAPKEKKETRAAEGASGAVSAGRAAPKPSAASQRAEAESEADQQAPAAPPPEMNSPLPTAAVATNSAVGGAVASPPPPQRSDSAQKSESTRTTGHAFGNSARGNVLAKSRSAAERSSQIVIQTPDADVAYRIADKGFIEHTEDGGATWHGQLLNPAAEFTAGSAPAPSICWLVGRAGVIFLTVDGKNWRKLPSPSTDDFVAIVAKSARSATVTVTEEEKWSTRNAGKTWRPAN